MTQPVIGNLLLSAQFAPAPIPYTPARLQSDLAAGVAGILASAGTDYRMWVDSAGAKVEIGHKALNTAGLGAGYSGVLRTGLVINAGGIAAGYNKKTDGSWVNALAISSAGDVTIAGTLKAASIIEAGATVSGYGTVGTIASTASSAYSLANGKLSASTSYVLTGAVTVQDTGGIKAGTVTWDAATGAVTGGSGVVFTEAGIVGAKNGVSTFAITNAGDATFAGTIDTDGDVRFYGRTTAPQNLVIGGSSYSVDYSCMGFASSNPVNLGYVRAGVLGYAPNAAAAVVIGVVGRASSSTRGIGCVGDGGFRGGYFTTTNSAGVGLIAHNTAGGTALQAAGKSQLDGNVTVAGSLTATDNITAYGSSDLRLKQNIRALESPLESVRKLRGVRFDWTDEYLERHGGEDGYFVRRQDVGVIAQEVQAVLPEIVATKQDGTLGVRYEKLVPLLIEAIKVLSERVEKLEAAS